MAADPDVSSVASLSGDPVIAEARKRWDRCAEWEAQARERFLDDLRFRHGDSDNGYQWPNAIRRARDVDSKPCLTINNIGPHNLQIVNDAKQNKSSVKIKAVGNGATKDAADIFGGIIRHIEYQSNAQDVYSQAIEFQVDGGIGWWRIVTEYANDDTFEQEIFLRPVPDPLSVYMDPDCQQKDCSDAKFAFVFDSMPKDDFDEAWPQYAGLASLAPLGSGTGEASDWLDGDDVRVCEYFRMVPREDKLVEFRGQDGRARTTRLSRLHPSMHREILDDPQTRVRSVMDQVCEWKLIVGERVIDETVWPSKFIPLIRVLGTQTVIDGVLDRKGHTRTMKDAQRMYNYNASAQVEFVALQGKTPWTGAAKAIEEFESMWNTANTVNHSFLPFNHLDDDGNSLPPEALPRRVEPPVASAAFESGMTTAFNQLMMASGQWQNQLGMMGNERTGSAIEKRQHQSDTAVFHFQDNYASAMRYCGKQLLDLIPRVYDTARVIKIVAEDGSDQDVELDPTARQAYLEQQAHNGEVIRRVLNPQIGRYDVEAGVGPAYGTRREETVQALTLILTQAPALTGIIGDLLLSAMDFDKAQEAAMRLRRMVPSQALGKGPSEAEQKLTGQVQALQLSLGKALERLAKDQLKLVGKGEKRDIDAYGAITQRAKVLLDHGIADRQLNQDLHEIRLDALLRSNEAEIASEEEGQASAQASLSSAGASPVPGAQQAPDGEWYLADPQRVGKYLRVRPLAQEHRQGRGLIG